MNDKGSRTANEAQNRVRVHIENLVHDDTGAREFLYTINKLKQKRNEQKMESMRVKMNMNKMKDFVSSNVEDVKYFRELEYYTKLERERIMKERREITVARAETLEEQSREKNINFLKKKEHKAYLMGLFEDAVRNYIMKSQRFKLWCASVYVNKSLNCWKELLLKKKKENRRKMMMLKIVLFTKVRS